MAYWRHVHLVRSFGRAGGGGGRRGREAHLAVRRAHLRLARGARREEGVPGDPEGRRGRPGRPERRAHLQAVQVWAQVRHPIPSQSHPVPRPPSPSHLDLDQRKAFSYILHVRTRRWGRPAVATEIMAASFRNTREIVALAGCDLLTVSPSLLSELNSSHETLTPLLGERMLQEDSSPRTPHDCCSADFNIRLHLYSSALFFCLFNCIVMLAIALLVESRPPRSLITFINSELIIPLLYTE